MWQYNLCSNLNYYRLIFHLNVAELPKGEPRVVEVETNSVYNMEVRQFTKRESLHIEEVPPSIPPLPSSLPPLPSSSENDEPPNIQEQQIQQNDTISPSNITHNTTQPQNNSQAVTEQNNISKKYNFGPPHNFPKKPNFNTHSKPIFSEADQIIREQKYKIKEQEIKIKQQKRIIEQQERVIREQAMNNVYLFPFIHSQEK